MVKRILKKSVAIGLTGVMTFSMVGCGDNDKETSSDGVVTIKVQENETAKKQGYFEDLLAAFNKQYEGKIVAVDADEKEYVDMAKVAADGYAPDVTYQANDYIMKYAEDKIFYKLNPEDFECYDSTATEAWDAFKIVKDGETAYCGVPVNIQEPMLFYREDMLPDNWKTDWDDNSNDIPDFFENWNDMYAYSKQIHDADSSKYGYMACVKDVYFTSGYLFSYGAYVFNQDDSGTYDTKDIGFSKNNAVTGASVIRQIASLMNEECCDDSLKTKRYEYVANGTCFCASSTPDTYSLFTDKLEAEYKKEGKSDTEAATLAEENLKMIQLPSLLPADGDLTKDASTMSDSDWVQSVQMGGVSGYGINSYSEHIEESITFVDFATSYDMLLNRADTLGLACTRSDVAEKTGDVTSSILNNLKEGRIYLMPSVKEIGQIWTAGETFFSDLAKDPFREAAGSAAKYTTTESLQEGLEKMDKSIYDAINTLTSDDDETTGATN